MIVNRFYVILGSLAILGGIGAVIGQAWGLSAILLVIGLAILATEFWTNRRHGYVPLQGGPDVTLERIKAQGLQNALLGGGRPMPDPPPRPTGGDSTLPR